MTKTISFISKEHIDKYWPQVKGLLDKGLFYCEDELNIDQLRYMAVQGVVHIVVAIDDDTASLVGALALQITQYPNLRAATIISYGGYDLFADEEDFAVLKTGLEKGGVSRIEGWCRPAQARLFKSKFGFETPYQMITYRIGD